MKLPGHHNKPARRVVFSHHANQRLSERLDSDSARERITKQVLLAYQNELYSSVPPRWISQKLHGASRLFIQMKLDKEAPVCVVIANDSSGQNPPLIVVTIIADDKYKRQKDAASKKKLKPRPLAV